MRVLSTAFLLLMASLTHSALADGLPSSPYIVVSGHGELQVAPDMAYLSLTLVKTEVDAKAARADVEDRSAKVIALARKLGIADKDIDAPAVTIQPQYGYEPRVKGSPDEPRTLKLIGQRVTRGVVLTLRDLNRYGELVDGLFDIGVTTLDGVTPDRSDRDALQQKARALAVADARATATGLAQSAGVTLGDVYSIAEQGENYGPRPMMRAASMSGAEQTPEYLNGRIEIGADVTIYYLIGK